MKINQVKTGAILNYLQLFLGIIISLAITPVIIRKLGQSEYGIFNLSMSTISYLDLLTLGVGGAFIKFNMRYRVAKDKDGENRLNATFLIIYLIFGLIISIVGVGIILSANIIFGNSMTIEEVNTTQIVLGLNLLNMVVTLPFSVFRMNINAYEKFVFAKVINILNTVINPLVRLPVALLGGKSIGITIVMVSINILTCVIQMFYGVFKLKIGFKFGRLDKNLLKELFSFSFFIVLNQLVDMINWTMDNFILGVVCGTTVVAVYSVGATFSSYTKSFSSAISSVLGPRAYKLVESGGSLQEVDDLFIKTGRIQFILMAFVLSAFVFFGKPFIVNIYADESYVESYYIAILLIGPLTIPLIQNLGIEIQRAMNKHKFRSIAYLIIAVINLGITIPLSMYYGGFGAAIGTCVSMIIGNGFIMNIYYSKGMGLNIKKFWWNIVKFIPGLILPLVLGSLLMIFVDMSNIWVFLGCAIGYTVIYGISMFFIGMNEYEKSLIIKPLKKIFQKLFNKKTVSLEKCSIVENSSEDNVEENINDTLSKDDKDANM